jgi:Tfp pilus assembly protein PilX
MQLEQQENFTIHGPQLEILGEVETKLPAPAKKRGTASIVLVALALVSVLGIGGAKLKGVYRETAEIYTSAQDEYGHSIQGDFETQADAAANLIKQAGYVDSTPAAALQEAEDALATWNDTDDSPAVQYAANRRLYNAVDTLYASLNNKVDDSTQRALDDQYNAFVSAHTAYPPHCTADGWPRTAPQGNRPYHSTWPARPRLPVKQPPGCCPHSPPV